MTVDYVQTACLGYSVHVMITAENIVADGNYVVKSARRCEEDHDKCK